MTSLEEGLTLGAEGGADGAYVGTGQELLHDVAVVDLPAAAEPLFLRVQLLILLNLKRSGQISA